MAESNTTEIHGRALRLHTTNYNLFSHGKEVSMPAIDASITVGAEGATAANVRTISVQLKDSLGKDIDYVEIVDVFMFLSSAKTAIATTGGSTGLAIKTDGAILSTVVAKKHFVCSTEADGDLDFTYTDTATSETVCFGLRLPSGRVITSSAFANA